jgi:hypothetical protein
MILLIAIALIGVDFVTTLVGVRLAGSDIEANVIWRRVFARFGPFGFSIGYVVCAATIVFACSWLGDEALVGLIACLSLVALNNCYALVRLMTRGQPRA